MIDDPNSGRYDAAFTCQQEALEKRQALKDTRGISESLFQIGAIHERWQQYDQARQYYIEALQIADRYGHLFEKAEPTSHLAIHALLQGNLEEALSLALVALELRQVLHFKPYQPLDHLLLRDIYQAKGDHAKVELHEQKASRLAEEMGYPMLVSSMPGIKSRLSK
ncbi:MAG TPA: tetratricopeptide repeat protein [Chloroflexia bacterium]|nr:tetratricopeptide repeat protein [Chloroflexia bacterium]